MFSTENQSRIRILDKAKQKIDDSLDIKQIIRTHEMIKILSSGLLSTQSLLLSRVQTSPLLLNYHSEAESESDPQGKLNTLENWHPTKKIDKILLKKVLQRKETRQARESRESREA